MKVLLSVQSDKKKEREGGGWRSLIRAGKTGSCSRHVYKFKNISDALAMLLILVQWAGGMRGGGMPGGGMVLHLFKQLLLENGSSMLCQRGSVVCLASLRVKLNRLNSCTSWKQ